MKKTIFLLLLFASCMPSRKVSILSNSQSLPIGASVNIIGIGQKLPENAKLLGQIRIGDNGFSTNCKYDEVLAIAVNECRKMGANTFQIIQHKDPTALGSTCHRIKGDAYLVK